MKFLFAVVFIVIDFITGMIKSFRQKNFDSSKMREGLLNKLGEFCALILGFCTDRAMPYLDLGTDIPVFLAIASYISLMEILSTIENLGGISPKLVPEKLKKYFKKIESEEIENE